MGPIEAKKLQEMKQQIGKKAYQVIETPRGRTEIPIHLIGVELDHRHRPFYIARYTKEAQLPHYISRTMRITLFAYEVTFRTTTKKVG